MAKQREQLKCSSCKNQFGRELITVKSGKNYCPECLSIREREIEESKENRKDFNLLFDYICKIYNLKEPTGLMFHQIKEFKGENYNYTESGMYYTLVYYYEIMESKVLEGTGLGIIPYYYEKAKRHYQKVYDLEDMVDIFENNEKINKIIIKKHNKIQEKKEPLPLNINWEEDNEDHQKAD